MKESKCWAKFFEKEKNSNLMARWRCSLISWQGEDALSSNGKMKMLSNLMTMMLSYLMARKKLHAATAFQSRQMQWNFPSHELCYFFSASTRGSHSRCFPTVYGNNFERLWVSKTFFFDETLFEKIKTNKNQSKLSRC